MKISNIMVALIAALGLLLTTPGWSKKPTKISGSLPLPVSQKELMCHKGRQIIDISVNALPAHAAHGDWVVDDANPCPAEGDGAPSLCLDTNNRDFDVGILNHVLADLPGGLDAAFFARASVVIDDALYPVAPDLPVWAVGHDGGVFHRDGGLIIEAIRHPALDRRFFQLAAVHQQVELMK